MSNFENKTKRASEENALNCTYADLLVENKNIKQQFAIMENKIRLLKKALTRMVSEFDTATPVIPNQAQALRFSNNILNSCLDFELQNDICLHPYNEMVMSDKKDKNGLLLLECKVCGKLL
jgi:hypothetical protein